MVLTNHAEGGAIGVPQWGKHWLSCLNLYDWDGVNPVPPELWYVASTANMLPILTLFGLRRLLPDWIPFIHRDGGSTAAWYTFQSHTSTPTSAKYL